MCVCAYVFAFMFKHACMCSYVYLISPQGIIKSQFGSILCVHSVHPVVNTLLQENATRMRPQGTGNNDKDSEIKKTTLI